MRFVFALMGAAFFSSMLSAQALAVEKPSARAIDFEGAQWIWSSSAGLDPTSFAAGTTFYRAETDIPRDGTVRSAEVIVTADNDFTLFVNGKSVGESAADNSAWHSPKRFDITKLVRPGRCVFAVEAVNTLPGAAGLLLKSEIRLADGRVVTLQSDEAWKCVSTEQENWQQLAFEHGSWESVRVLANYGGGLWGKLAVPALATKAGPHEGKVHQLAARVKSEARRYGNTVVERAPPSDFVWPEGIVFLGDDCSLYRPSGGTNSSLDSLNVTIFNPRKSRAFPEHDLPGPMKVGRKLLVIRPAKPGVEPRLLLDAGEGGIGSPCVTFDGKAILFSMAREGDPFFHIYRIAADGGEPEQLTDGPFHDIDPAELPDGRIVFTSTRIGTFEEYHSPPSRSLFLMSAAGKDINPLTHTLIFDNEPEVLADGRILFIRSDNFFDRGKVETQLHAIHPDGTDGHTEFGLDNGPEYGGRLRAFYCGSPAPMVDGRVAFVSSPGITVGQPGAKSSDWQNFRIAAGDVAAMPDNRLICTTARNVSFEVGEGANKQTRQELRYETIGILDPQSSQPVFVPLYKSPDGSALHSPVYLGAKPRPPILPEKVKPGDRDDPNATGFFFCRNARLTKNTTAGWEHVRAVRVIAAKGLTVRSSHSYIVHAGSEVLELGTVPLADDGSFHVEVPANTPIAFQMVDAEGRSELNEMSWIFVRPGEQRGCIGCHQTRQVTPDRSGELAQALKTPPLKLLGQGKPHAFRGNNAAVTGLMELQFDRYREVAGLNRHTGASHSQASGTQEVKTLIEQLQSDDVGERISAAQCLAVFRDPLAAPALALSLRDRSSREVRVAAAMTLAVCGTRDSIEPLLKALSDREPLVAMAAGVAIENLTGHVEPVSAFAERAERKTRANSWKQWFESTSWQQIEAGLIGRLKSDDRDVARRAAVALGHTGSNAARSALRQYVLVHRDFNPLPAWRKDGHRGDAARFNAASPVNPRTLQAAIRALGYLKDRQAIPLLAETIAQNIDPATCNLFLAEAAAEALGRMESDDANKALVEAFASLRPYPEYTRWYGDHDALMACHASPLHYFITEALDAREYTQVRSIAADLIRSVPIDPDRALFLGVDDCEALVGRVIRRSGAEAEVVETCLSILGDQTAKRSKDIEQAIAKIHRCWAGEPTPANRAAQILSLVCRDAKYEPRIRAAFARYRETEQTIPRVFDTGIPVVDALPTKNWVCFYLARTLGHIGAPESAAELIATLKSEEAEAASGRPDPLGAGVLFLHNELTPCWRAAVAWALGQIGDTDAVPVLLDIVADLENATDTRHAAAEALGKIGDPDSLAAIRTLAKDYPEISTRLTLLKVCDGLTGSEE